MLFKKDIYKALRPVPDNSILGWYFKDMASIKYSDALIYPRFKLLDEEKAYDEKGIFETSDYQKILEIFGLSTIAVCNTPLI
jgi:hypothetical protein